MVEVPREIARELAPAEKVLWTGQPRQGLVLRGYDVFALPFGMAWLGMGNASTSRGQRPSASTQSWPVSGPL